MNLPLVDAILNAVTAILLLGGFVAIKRGRRELHRTLMVTAFVTSMAFLVCYLLHKYWYGITLFQGQGWSRPLYFFILGTHTILAMVNLPLILWTIWLAFSGRLERHRRVAPWTFLSWMYVSVTGVLVYFMLYRWFPHN
jgi:putative membrane protein